MIYVMSDIHGQARRFHSILDQIALKDEDTLYILGDVIDRNPDGIRILKEIMSRPNMKMLLGNHELMMLQSLYYPSDEATAPSPYLSRWYRNGGKVTHDYLKRIRKQLRAEIFSYLDALPLNIPVEINGQKYLLVHAAPVGLFPDYGERYDTKRDFAVWWRQLVEIPLSDERTIIAEFTTTHHYQADNPMRIWYGSHMIGLDCGSSYPENGSTENGYSGRLACLRPDDMKEFYSVD